MMIALFLDNHVYVEWHGTSFNESLDGEILEMGLLVLSKREYALIMVMFTKIYIFGNWTKSQMCGIINCQQMDIMWKICHAIVRGDFWCRWSSEGI